jgi:hypothetical protein
VGWHSQERVRPEKGLQSTSPGYREEYSQEKTHCAVKWTSYEKEQYNQEKKDLAMRTMYLGKKG